MGTMDPDKIKHELYSTRVLEYREELRESVTEGTTTSKSRGTQTGQAAGQGSGATENFFDDEETLETSKSWSKFKSDSDSESESESESTSYSKTTSTVFVPVLGKELSNVQFRPLEEQLFKAMAVLFDQKQRHGVARLCEMSAPVSIMTPTIQKVPASTERVKGFINRAYEKLPFALPGLKAQQQIAERERGLSEKLSRQA
jgi:hypothetical protein